MADGTSKVRGSYGALGRARRIDQMAIDRGLPQFLTAARRTDHFGNSNVS
jgi:hypothetical protein